MVRDLKLSHPEIEIDVDTTCMDLWRHNPHLTRLWNHNRKHPKADKPGVQFIKCQYGKGIREQNSETIHFAAYFHRNFKKQTGIDVPVLFPYGDIHLSEEERTQPIIPQRNWILLSGGKSDFTIKVWRTDYFQTVIDELNKMNLGVVQLGSNDRGHWHPEVTGTINMIGKTNLRDMMRMIYHSDGVICGVTVAMHMAAALGRPCVTIAGGREAWWWEAYVNENSGFGPASGNIPMPHKFLHTIGLLDCCRHHGCWKNKVVPMNGDRLVCKRPIHRPGMPIAECMDMITPAHVMEAVMAYYQDKSLPPITVDASGVAPPLAPPAMPPGVAAAGNQQVVPRKPVNLIDAVSGNGNGVAPTDTAGIVQVPQYNAAMLETRGPNHQHVGVATRPGGSPQFSDETVFDHADVGGRFTACVVMYGPEAYFNMHRQCLSTLIATMPKGRLDLRVASNELNQKSVDMIEEYVAQGLVTKHYQHPTNDFKYPLMREMFFDTSCPITTKWVLWFDDDSMCDVEPSWAFVLAQHIVQHYRNGNNHMFGAKHTWTTNQKTRDIFRSRPWYKGKPWRSRNGKPSPNGNKIVFATGGFWAITHESIVKADIPDLGTGLTHTGGDWQIGEQLYQAGFNVKQFNGKKQFIRSSSVDRRGITMPTIDKISGVTPVADANLIPVATQPQRTQTQRTETKEIATAPRHIPPPAPLRVPRTVPVTSRTPKLIKL